ncbi:MAG: FAD-dependent pyridine nucleotide-disulfide oxidoreductase [Frankiales bacterium]|nr:FAD-dependent pyridine nucleotide-disulfide oxidoreductase [Frankiales bacterium]
MNSERTFLIVGASLAGAKAAETLRADGFDGRVVLIGAESERPYERPPLSKDYLAGTSEKDKVYVHAASWYAEHEVELRLDTRATALDTAGHTVSLQGGESLSYTKVLLTTGSTPRRLDVPGNDLDGIFTLRTVGDSEAIRAAISRGGPVVVIGGGWIGLETAAAARGYGADVTIIEPRPTPLHAVLGPEMGEVFAQLHRDHGVDLRVNTGVREIRGSGRRAVGVVTDSGEEVAADTVIVGVGIQPNVELAEHARLTVDNGIVVDAHLQTSDPDVYAAGDVANFHHPLLDRRIRVEHWANALHGGPAAARAMLGTGQPYDRVPYFYSDQYDLGMEYSGLAAPGDYDQVLLRGDQSKREFIAFWLREQRVLAGMNVNVWDVTDPIQQLVRSAAPVDPARLTDTSVPLDQVFA